MDKLDIKLWSLAAKGQIVPDRSLLKTPDQIEAIKKSAALQRISRHKNNASFFTLLTQTCLLTI